jgi:hypothetical protein
MGEHRVKFGASGSSWCSAKNMNGVPLKILKPIRHPGAHRRKGKTYGAVSADRQKEMSDLGFVQGLVDGKR